MDKCLFLLQGGAAFGGHCSGTRTLGGAARGGFVLGELLVWGRCMVEQRSHQNTVQIWGAVPVCTHNLSPKSRRG